MYRGTLFRNSVSPVVEAPRQRVVPGAYWSLNLGIPVLIILSLLNLVVSLVK